MKKTINNCLVSKSIFSTGLEVICLHDSLAKDEPSLTNSIEESIKHLAKTSCPEIYRHPIVALGTDGLYSLVILNRFIPFVPLKAFDEESIMSAIFGSVYQSFRTYVEENNQALLAYGNLADSGDIKNFKEKLLNDDSFFDELEINIDLKMYEFQSLYDLLSEMVKKKYRMSKEEFPF